MPRASEADTDKKTSARKPRARATTRKAGSTRTTRSSTSSARRVRATRGTTKVATRRAPAAKKSVKKLADTESKQSASIKEVLEKETSETRKAPTRFAAARSERRTKRTQYLIVATLLLVGVGASAAVGFTDAGRIDVAETIQARNERMANLVEVDGPVTVAPTPSVLPDGGFVAAAEQSVPVRSVPPAETVAATTSTSTPITGTSSITATSSSVTAASTTTAAPIDLINHSATTTVQATSSEPEEAV